MKLDRVSSLFSLTIVKESVTYLSRVLHPWTTGGPGLFKKDMCISILKSSYGRRVVHRDLCLKVIHRRVTVDDSMNTSVTVVKNLPGRSYEQTEAEKDVGERHGSRWRGSKKVSHAAYD